MVAPCQLNGMYKVVKKRVEFKFAYMWPGISNLSLLSGCTNIPRDTLERINSERIMIHCINSSRRA